MTMVRNDNFFLSRWVRYYGHHLGRENLFVFFDGDDQALPPDCEGVNVSVRPHIDMEVTKGDKDRADFMSRQASLRFAEGYERVIGTDVDEFLVVDPLTGMSLQEFLSRDFRGSAISALGVDVAQNLKCEQEVVSSEPFLSQRSFALFYPRYTKANVLLKPCRWGSGYHRVKGKDIRIASGLYLFHFGCVDIEMIRNKIGDVEKIRNGWSRHLKKRAKTIRIVSGMKPWDWDRIVKYVRIMQQYCRPVFAWNKPTLFGWKVVVRIPSRFSDIV